MEPIGIDTPENSQPLSPKRPKRFWALLGVVVLVVIIASSQISAPASFPEGETVFTIKEGDALVNVGRSLEEKNYIRSTIVFSTFVTLFGGEHRISPGDYYFRKGESAIGIALQVARGDHNVQQIKVTVPEGETLADISLLLSEKLPGFDSAAFKIAAAGMEGYLFPETYFFYPTTTAQETVKEMRAMFDTKTSAVFVDADLRGYTKEQIVVMASLVEREAHGSDDRGTIAGILYNRLKDGMRLQVDATVAYAAGKGDTTLTKADFSVDSPYNTYTHAGLPPGPIANPGLASIKAALNPDQTAYLYYLHDKNGSIHYAKTYADHQKNIAKYLK